MQGDHYVGPVAEWYDDWLSARTDDVDFYTGFFRGFPGTTLELACGTGRILLPIAREGVDIQGLDSSEDMLKVLASKASRQGLRRIPLHHQPMESFSISTRFDSIFATSGSFQLLTQPGAAMGCLTCIRKHLNDHGFFITDIFVPWDSISARETDVYRVTRDTTRPNGERSIVLERFTVDLETQIKRGTYRYEFYDSKRLVSCITDDLAIRWYWKDEFRGVLREAGFTHVDVLADSPLYEEGHSFVFKAAK
jgi:SAM-dependent methyltransferase